MAERWITNATLIVSLTVGIACAEPHAHGECMYLSVSDAWIREPPPPANVAAAYMTIRNDSTAPATIVDVDSDCCDHAMMHESVLEGGRAAMHHREKIEIAPAAVVEFKPQGLHIMLMQPEVKPEQRVDITLRCADESHQTVGFHVRKSR